jgi:type IV secretory pathway VirB10-like protein
MVEEALGPKKAWWPSEGECQDREAGVSRLVSGWGWGRWNRGCQRGNGDNIWNVNEEISNFLKGRKKKRREEKRREEKRREEKRREEKRREETRRDETRRDEKRREEKRREEKRREEKRAKKRNCTPSEANSRTQLQFLDSSFLIS